MNQSGRKNMITMTSKQILCSLVFTILFFQSPIHAAAARDSSIGSQTEEFSLSLAKHLLTSTNGNFVFSPLSIHAVLSMVAAGSDGPTRDQLLGFVKSKSVEDLTSLSSKLSDILLRGPHLSSAGGVWVDRHYTLKPAFRKTVELAHRATAQSVDFQAKADEVRKAVNEWAEKRTDGLIKELLPPGSVNPESTKLILANALHFKGAWNVEFDALLTRHRHFFLSGDGANSSVQVPFMSSHEPFQYVDAFDGFKVLSLPYKQGDDDDDDRRFSMHIFLPDDKDGLPALVDKFGSTPGFIQRHLPREREAVGDFRIPKFKIDSGFDASKVLKGQGLVLPFSGRRLTEMVSEEGLDISGLYHKSSIEVDEQGTKAAAASAVHLINGIGLDFVADHPFLFVVREDVSGAVLFVGQLLNPLSG